MVFLFCLKRGKIELLGLEKKIKVFEVICGDWDFREIDMTNPHLSGIAIINNTIIPSCEMYSTILDDYVICDSSEIEDKNLVYKFKKLNITNKPKVLDFIFEIENSIDWDKVRNDLYDIEKSLKQELDDNKNRELEEIKNKQYIVILENEKIIFESKDLALSYYKDLAWMYDDEQKERYKNIYNQIEKTNKIYSDGTKILSEKYFNYEDYDNMDAVMVPCKLLGEGWFWKKYNDGSGYLESPNGKNYMEYDLQTKEYKIDENSWWSSYIEGYEEIPTDFNFFRMAEEELKNYISKKNDNDFFI